MKRKFTFLMAAFTLLAFLAIPMGVKGQAQVGDTLWAENFSGYAANDVPSGEVTNSHTGTTVYGDVTLTYACSDGGTSTKIYDANLAGGSKPELLISKKNTESGGTFSISGISTGGAIELTLKYKENYDYTSVTSTTPEVTFSNKTFDNKTCTITITTNGVSSINLTFTNTNSSNVRVDDFSLIVKTSSSTDPYITAEDVTLDWDATSGEIDYTLNNAVTGGLLTAAATSGEWISNVAVDTENSKVTFTTTANPDGEREGTITITYTYNTNQTVTKEVAVTQQTRPSYTVTYVANGGTGTMTDPNSPYYSNADVTLLDNSFTAPEGQMWSAWVVTDGAGESITVTNGHFTMPESNVTVTPQWVNDPSAPTYEWVLTALADLTTSDVFVIVGTVSNSSYSMSNNSTSNPAAVAVTISNDKIISTVADSIKWNISGNATNGYTFYPNGSTTTWLYCNTTASSGSNTNLRVGGGNNSTRKLFVPEGTTLKTKDSNTARFWNVYSGGPDWRGYTSNSTSTTVTFYKRQIASTDPNITASDVEIEYDATSGSFDFTLNNPVSGGELSVTDNVDWISEAAIDGNATDGYSVSFATTVNEAATAREGIITLTYTYGDSQTVTKEVTVTQAAAPLVYTTIPALFAAATSTEQSVLVTFNGWVVTGVSTNGKYVFVTDGNGNGFVIYSSSSMANIYEVGNTLTGTVECTLKLNAGYARLTNVPSESLTLGTGGSVGFAEIEMADLAGVNTGALVQYENLTCSISGNNYFLSDGTTTLQLFNSLFAFEALQAGHTYNISGVYQQYNTTKEILPRSADDIEEVVIVTPSITVTPDIINASAEGASGTLVVTYENIPDLITFDLAFCDAEGNDLEGDDPDWIDCQINVPASDEDYTVSYTISANNGEARTAYFKVNTYDTPGNEEVYAIVTVNQAAYVPPFEPATYILANSIVSGQTYIIVGRNGDDYAMGIQNNNNRSAVGITINGTTASVQTEDVYEFVITALDEPGFYSIYDARYPGYLFAASSSSNHLKTESELDGNGNGDWKITINAETGVASIVASNSSNRNVMQYNNGSHLFSCYASATQSPVYLYMKSNEPYISVSPNLVEEDSNEHDGTLALAYANLEISVMSDFGVQYYDAEGEETSEPEWIEVLVAEQDPEIGDGYVVSYYMIENEGEERTVYFKVFAMDDEEFVYSNLVTVTQAAAPEPSITLAPDVVNVSAEGGLCGFAVSLANIPASGPNQGISFWFYDAQPEWIPSNGIIYDLYLNPIQMDSIYFTVLPNTTTESRSVDIKLVINGIVSNLVTITQAAYEAPATTGTIVFGNNGTKINAANVTGDDSIGNTWTITTIGTTSFTQNAEYSQVGKSSEPATSITFTTTLPQEATITAFSAKFGGFNGTAGDVSLNVGETEVGSGSLNGTADVVVENTQTATGTVLTVTVTNIAKGVKCYYISYSISLGTDPIITVPISVNLASDATEGEFTYSIINPVAGVTLSATSTDEWISNIAVTADNVTFTTTANTETTERQGTITVSYEGAEDKTVTVIQAAYVAPVPTTTYTLATSIESGRHYIIVAMDGDEAYAMGGQNNNNRAAVSITVEDGVAQVSSDDVYEFVINTVGFTDEIDPYFEPRSGWSPAAYPGYWKYTIYDAAQPGYLYAASSSNNYLKTETHLDANDNGVWAIEIYDENETQYAAHIAAFGDNTRKVMRYNSSNHIFSCYGTGNNMKSICLYVKDEDLPQYDFYKDVKGYGTSEGGYALMATPTTENANPNLVGMITDDGTDPDNFTYDLYGFDFTQDQEWRNYRSNAFNMNNGQGYLYANKNNVTLHFQGASYTSYKTVNLQFGNTNNHWNGWNLIGNPRSDVSWVGTSNFYVMNEAGTELELSNRSYVNPMEGIFVKATAANQSIYFADFWYYEEEWLDEILNIKVNGNNSSGDFARIRFGEGRNLEKFMLNQNHTKLYFTQGNKDFAVVRSANEGEMPVNFKAETNGTYTISVKAENVDMSYLHLIDNVTGADVDLMATPSYSFEAKTTDYANRFRLVFKANASVSENADAESFAFFNGSTWTVSNLGEATLQVVDMTGRVLSSETVNGNAEISINQTPGVYMLRLINGENVKVQKVVVK